MLLYRRRLLSTPPLGPVWWAPVPAGTITRTEFFETPTTDQTVTGSLFADPDSFGAGTISSTYSVTGTLFADPDSFGAGTTSSAYSVTGSLFADPDSFGTGAISMSFLQTITGVLFGDPDAFGAGTVAEAVIGPPSPHIVVPQQRLVM